MNSEKKTFLRHFGHYRCDCVYGTDSGRDFANVISNDSADVKRIYCFPKCEIEKNRKNLQC